MAQSRSTLDNVLAPGASIKDITVIVLWVSIIEIWLFIIQLWISIFVMEYIHNWIMDIHN